VSLKLSSAKLPTAVAFALTGGSNSHSWPSSQRRHAYNRSVPGIWNRLSHCTASFHLRDIRLSAVGYFDSEKTKELRFMMSQKGQEMRL
jgi:hypothetical protein